MFCASPELDGYPRAMNRHEPVLCGEVIEALTRGRTGRARYLDGTFGGGGHTRGLLESHPAARVLALDCDPAARARAEGLEREYPGRLEFVGMNFGDLEELGAEGFDGALFDLGVSSFQLDDGERGFSFRVDAPADMRLDPTRGRSAGEFLETAAEKDLVRAVRDFGEEPHWKRAVQAILAARGTGKLFRTQTLATLIVDAVGERSRYGRSPRIHPATRTFQGIRIAVNRELEALERVLPVAFRKLVSGGVLAVISFHSLEDRIVKRFMRRMAGRPEHEGDYAPQDSRTVLGRLITTKPLVPGDTEIQHNPRSRSARLRLLAKD